MKKVISIILLCFCAFGINAQSTSQTLATIFLKDGQQQEITISSNGKIYFSNHKLIINANGMDTETESEIAIDDIQKVTFKSIAAEGIETYNDNEALWLYPNPADNHLTITSDKRICQIQLFDINGKCIHQRRLQSNSITLPISELAKGTYILRAILQNNQTISKQFIKH